MTRAKSISRLREVWIDRWIDEWMADREAIGLGIVESPVYLVVVVVVYQVALLRHGCQDLTVERRRQSVDTDSSG